MKFRKINLVALCFADRGFGVIKPGQGHDCVWNFFGVFLGRCREAPA